MMAQLVVTSCTYNPEFSHWLCQVIGSKINKAACRASPNINRRKSPADNGGGSICEAHGQALHGHPEFLQGAAGLEPKAQIIVEADGTMIPMVTMDSTQPIDQRRTRKTCWKEARLTLAYENGSTEPVFGATTGSPEQTGEQLACCAFSTM